MPTMISNELFETQNATVIAADLPSSEYSESSCEVFPIASTEECPTSSPQHQGCNSDFLESTSEELPPPHRFIRSNSQKSKTSEFNLLRTCSDLPYLAMYRQRQGCLLASDSTPTQAVSQDELWNLAKEIVQTYQTTVK